MIHQPRVRKRWKITSPRAPPSCDKSLSSLKEIPIWQSSSRQRKEWVRALIGEISGRNFYTNAKRGSSTSRKTRIPKRIAYRKRNISFLLIRLPNSSGNKRPILARTHRVLSSLRETKRVKPFKFPISCDAYMNHIRATSVLSVLKLCSRLSLWWIGNGIL